MKKTGITFSTMILLLGIAQSAAAQSASAATEPVSKVYITILSLMPIALFVLLFIIIIVSTNWRELLHDILSDKEANPVSKVIQPMIDKSGNHVHVDGVPQTTTVDIYPKSASRLVLFCSSLSAIIISLCMVSASIYSYLLDGSMPDFDNLLGVVMSLGIGVIPYMTSKIRNGGSNVPNKVVNLPSQTGNTNTQS